MSRHRLRTVPRSRVALLVAAAASGVFLVGSVVHSRVAEQDAQSQAAVVQQQRDATAAQAASLAEQIRAACAAKELSGPVCQQAEQVAAEPIPGPAGPRGPGPTPEQIRAAVEAYLVENPPPPGRGPTTEEIAAAVTDYLTANPPAPGRPPTAAEIAAAVELYFKANPPRQGEPGRPPTAEEIRAAVDAYLAENPPPSGKPGARGAQGVGVRDVRTDKRDDGCFLVFVLVDPTDGSTSERAVKVTDAVCEDGV